MTLLLYGHYDYVEVAPGGLVHVSIGPFARLLRTKNDRLREYFDWLAQFNYLQDLKHYRGYVTFRVTPSPLMEKLGGTQDAT